MPHDTPPLVGRARILDETVRRAREGTGTLLVGPAGSGGSRLVQEATGALRRSGPAVPLVAARGTRAGAHRAFLALLDPAVAQRIDAADPAARGIDLLTALLALRLPVLAIDDAAVLDEAALGLLAQLARHGTVLLADGTGVTVPEPLAALEAEGRLVVVAVPPLTEGEVAELAEHLLGGPVDTELTHALSDVTEGRPGRLTEVVHDGVGSRSIVRTDGVWHLARHLPAPRSIRTAVRGAFTDLPREQRGWVAAVATAGAIADDLARGIAAPAVRAATDASGWTVHDDAARTTRVATDAGRAAIVDSLDVRARVAVLRRLLHALALAPQPRAVEERVAAAVWRVELGDEVDPQEALALALLTDPSQHDREVLLRAALRGGGPAATAALAEHLRQTRRPGEALEVIRAGLPGATTPAERVQLARVEALATGVAERRSAEALAALDQYLLEYERSYDLLAVRAGLLLLEGRLRESLETAEVVLAHPERSGFAEAFAQLQAALTLRELGLVDESAAAARRFAVGKRAAEAFPVAEALARWLPHETEVAVSLQLDPTEASLVSLHQRAVVERRATHRPLYAYTLGSIRLHRGDAAGAVRLLRESDAGSGAWRDGWRPRILAELAGALALSGAVDEAAATLARLRALRSPPVQRGRAGLAASRIAAARGDQEGAIALALEVADHGAARGLLLDELDGAFAAVLLGHRPAAERLLALGPAPIGAGRDAQRALARAVLDDDPAALDAATTRLWDLGLRLHAASAAASDGAGPETARRLPAWLTRMPTLRLPGAAAGRAGALTAREREVALLAATDRSDRAIAEELGIAVRTAQTHLARVYAKLGVHRRADLRTMLELA